MTTLNHTKIKFSTDDLQNDKEIEWNKMVLKHSIPQCCLELIQQLIKRIPPLQQPEVIYECWPLQSGLNSILWKTSIFSFFELLFQTDCVYSFNGGGKWLSLSESVFCFNNNSTLFLSLEKVLQNYIALVRLPTRQMDILHMVNQHSMHTRLGEPNLKAFDSMYIMNHLLPLTIPVSDKEIVVNVIMQQFEDLDTISKPMLAQSVMKEAFLLLSSVDNPVEKLREIFLFINKYSDYLSEMKPNVNLAEIKNFLPIRKEPPLHFPQGLEWRGRLLDEISLRESQYPILCIPQKLDEAQDLPLILGSTCLFVEEVPECICEIMSSSGHDLANATLQHFQHALKNNDKLHPNILVYLTFCMYKYLNSLPEIDKCYVYGKLTELLEMTDETNIGTRMKSAIKSILLLCNSSLTQLVQNAGQHEPLITRLKNILTEYKDGITIIKELIQNAEDAGATEVNILYDSRSHPTDGLMFPQMANTHGPALVVHNNSQFTDEDFANIIKLGGATKKYKCLKIGKFGIGFCSVYHITDVPSFVSRDLLHIFDPTLTRLRFLIQDYNQPGIKVSYTQAKSELSKQLTPYQGLFGFDAAKPYEGTIFRLPFRKIPSDISSTLYSDGLIEKLKDDLLDNASQLLLFLNNVKKLTFSTITIEGIVSKELCIKTRHEEAYPDIKKVIVKHGNVSETENWLLSSHVINDQKKYATASVACQLRCHSFDKFECVPIEGSLFCYLPLDLSTGLPAHVSANFAVLSNRSGICTASNSGRAAGKNEGRNLDERELWNEDLMKEVIPNAYSKLLTRLKELHESDKLLNYNFSCLFPPNDESKIKYPWEIFILRFYCNIENKELVYSNVAERWCSPRCCVFLQKNDLLINPETHEIRRCVLKAMKLLQPVYFDDKYLPVNVDDKYLPFFKKASRIRSSGHRGLKKLDAKSFVSDFFSNISLFADQVELRNEVIFYILKFSAYETHSILESCMCIPCQPKGEILSLASNLLDPQKTSKSSHIQVISSRFGLHPLQSFTDDKDVYRGMKLIGLRTDSDPPDGVLLQAAKSVQKLYKTNRDESLEIVKFIITCIVERQSMYSKIIPDLQKFVFVPVLSKPEGYFIEWKADNDNITLSSLSDVILPPSEDYYLLAGSQCLFVNTNEPAQGGCGKILQPSYLYTYMRCNPFLTEPSFKQVIAHFSKFLLALELGQSIPDKHKQEVCKLMYSFFNKKIYENYHDNTISEDIKIFFNTKPAIWTGECFVKPENVTTDNEWMLNGPFLFKTPSILADQNSLVHALTISNKFTPITLLETLARVHNIYNDTCVPGNYRIIVEKIIMELNKIQPEDIEKVTLELNSSQLEGITDEDFSSSNHVFLPDKNFILKPSKLLYMQTLPWLTMDDSFPLVHPLVEPKLAEQLGVRSINPQNFIKKHVVANQQFGRVKFGQTQSITQRIKDILHDYPFDSTLLKELLQNADDAGAKKIYVILDEREHEREKVPPKWKDLQGPALLVWNDAEFSEKDIEGIQRIGLGSKKHDSSTIGQFGIGFNVVYHITDCPSFISGGNTLCVFDPHCIFVEEATPENAGGRYNSGLWEAMSDLQTSYLLNEAELVNAPCSFKTGSLFRFPLRPKNKLFNLSEEIAPIITLKKLKKSLDQWVPQIKEALLFLNNITEFGYYIIQSGHDNVFQIKVKYKVSLDEEGGLKRQMMTDSLKLFKECSEPAIQTYCLHIESIDENTSGKGHIEKWIIQQGIGNIFESKGNTSMLNSHVLPKHGLAAPLNNHNNKFCGKVFCFLPLPIESGLPLHINGQFTLNTNRRSLWSGDSIDRKEWNLQIIEALSSSYVEFLERCKEYVSTKNHDTREQNFAEAYYNFFPFWKNSDGSVIQLNEYCSKLSKSVFKKLYIMNKQILISNFPCVTWHSLLSREDSFRQAYFKPLAQNDEELSFVSKLKMITTVAPNILREHFEELGYKLHYINPQTVFHFYCCHHKQIFDGIEYPCNIKTTFHNVSEFVKMLNYVLVPVSKSKACNQFVFPGSPFQFPFLLTTDNCLRLWSKKEKIFWCSESDIFSLDQDRFLHPALFDCQLSSEYFKSTKDFKAKDALSLFQKNFKHKLVESHKNGILEKIWRCITENYLFSMYREEIIAELSLIPGTNGELYNCNGPMIPLVRPMDHDKDFQLLKSLGLPVLDETFLPNYNTHIKKYCVQITDYESILMILCENHFIRNSELSVEDVNTLITYLSNIDFRKKANLHFLKTLPLFKPIQREDFLFLDGHEVYAWPENCCKAGVTKWAPLDKCLFLEWEENEYSRLGEFSLVGKVLEKEEIYMQFILPKLHKLNDYERYEHLEFIRDVLYDDAKHFLNSKNKKRSIIAKHFIESLKCCRYVRSVNDEKYVRIMDLCDHTLPIFSKTFPETFLFLEEGLGSQAWMDFFHDLGLRVELKVQEYVEFCQKISSSPGEFRLASQVLVNYLFTEKDEKTQKLFSDSVEMFKHIRFIEPMHFESLDTIYKHWSHGEGVLTCFNGAVVDKYAALVWTVKPIICLSTVCGESRNFESIPEIFEKLGVQTFPTVDQVLNNIFNISKSQFSNFQLLMVYDHQTCKKPLDREYTLTTVMLQNLSYLHKHDALDHIENLRKSQVPCIPIFAENDETKPVLVKPIEAIKKEGAEDFLPYISPVPKCLNRIDYLLTLLGVEETVGFKHILHLLDRIYQHTKEKGLNPNDCHMVCKAVAKLDQLLQVNVIMKKQVNSSLFSHFYLPCFSEGKWFLKKSTDLLYLDSTRYETIGEVNQHTYFFRIPQYSVENRVEKVKTEMEICEKLPSEIAPKELSLCCYEELVNKETQEGRIINNPLIRHINRLRRFKYLMQLEEILISEVGRSFKEEMIKKFITKFIEFINTLSLKVLEKDCTVKLIQNENYKIVIGIINPNFVLDTNTTPHNILYASNKVTARPPVLRELAQTITVEVLKLTKLYEKIDKLLLQKLVFAVRECLNVQSFQEVKSLCDRYNVRRKAPSDDQNQPEESNEINPQVGHCIPEMICDLYLDRNENNQYYPQEWVGYETEEEVFIWAVVLYKVESEDGHDDGKIPLYNILVNKKGNELSTKDVLACKLCKFDDLKDDSEITDALAIIERKKKINKEVIRVKNAPDEAKENMVRRLYMKYNPNHVKQSKKPLYKELHTFLLTQITRIENDELLLKANDEGNETYVQQCSWADFFPQWDTHVSRISKLRSRRKKVSKIKFKSAEAEMETENEVVEHLNSPSPQPPAAPELELNKQAFQLSPSHEEAVRWLKQAKADFQVISEVSSPCHRLFLAHEVIEKSLKAGVYELTGLNPCFLKQHQLICHAKALCAYKPGGKRISLVKIAIEVQEKEYYVKSRFPNQLEEGKSPTEVYSMDEANKIVQDAEKVLNFIDKKVVK